MARDPVCGAEVDELRARAVAIVDGATHYFCSAAHKEQFLREREKRPAPAPAAPAPVEKAVAAPIPVEKAVAAPTPVERAPAAAPEPAEPVDEVRIAMPKRGGATARALAVLLAVAAAIAGLWFALH
jgi:YHS domain-containing protein